MSAPSSRSRPRPATLRDVAERAGVSIKTVSNVVHEHPHVSSRTRSNVQRVITELGYRPQVAAQQLRTGTSGMLTLALPSLTFSYFSDLAQVFIDQAQARGRTVVLHSTSAGAEEERSVLRGFDRRIGDGVIFNPLQLGEEEIARLGRVTQPTVLIGEHIPEGRLPDGCDYVRIDNLSAVREATSHLLDQGRRRVAFVGRLESAMARQPHSSAALRLAGFQLAHSLRGLDADAAPVVSVEDWDRWSGLRAAEELGETAEQIDGIVCANDDLALGVLAGLRRAHRAVPGDVAVVGYDDAPEAPFASPSLSTISPDKTFLARIALDMLAERIDGYAGPPRTVNTPYHLVVRESSRV